MRSIAAFRCSSCGAVEPKWVGQCPSCQTWGSLAEDTQRGAVPAAIPVPLARVDAGASAHRPTGLSELDRVLGGGLVPGSVTLLGGEPGIGKSTLLLQALVAIVRTGATCLLICAEESAAQVKQRAARLGPVPDGLLVLPETSLPTIRATIAATRPAVCVIDSIQTIADPEIGSAAGSVTQVRDCACALARLAKETDVALILVGHVTKDGALAGPRALEHVVDTVLSFEGDRHHALRLLVAVKHRFGPTGELGLFEMTDEGMQPVEDPSGLLLGDRRTNAPGSAVVAALEGRRSLMVEVQALFCQANPGGRRSAQGVDSGRLAFLLAVVEPCAVMGSAGKDVFVSAVGGIRVVEPAADLGIALALVSAVMSIPVPDDIIAFGEIGLLGEVRQVPHATRRLAEAARLGFRRAIVPASVPDVAGGIELVRVETVDDAIRYLVTGCEGRQLRAVRPEAGCVKIV